MRRLTIFSLMWLGCAISCAAVSSVFADDSEQLAAQAIRAGQTQDIDAIETLAAGLRHESRLVRQSSAWALSQMNDGVADVAPALTASLADQDAKVRFAAAVSLGHLGRDAWRAEAALWQATLDRDVDVRCAALIALRTVSVSYYRSALGALTECLQSPEADVQSETIATAAVIQSRWNDDEKRMLVPHLGRVFSNGTDDLRLAAAVLLGDLGLPAAPVIPALATAADDLDEHVRAAALRSLGRLADEVDQRWNRLQAEQRYALRRPCDLATKTLASHGKDSEEVARLAEQFRQLTAGIQLISGEDSASFPTTAKAPAPLKPATTKKPLSPETSNRSQAGGWYLSGLALCVGLGLLWFGVSRHKVEMINSISEATSETTHPLETLPAGVAPRGVESRWQEINKLSDAALDATAQLNRSLSDDDPVARWRSASAITAVHHASVPHLLAAVTSSDSEVRRLAVTSLRGLGANAVPPFVVALRDDNACVRQAAAVTLGQIGLGAIDAVPQLISALSDTDSNVRAAAALALSAFGPHAMEAVPELRAKLADECVAVRARAAYALGQIGPAARRAGEDLGRLVSDPDVSVRRNSASALGGIGADTAIARPALRIALEDSDAGVRRCAVTALGLIDSDGSATDLQRALDDSDAGVRQCTAAVLGISIPIQPTYAESFNRKPEACAEHEITTDVRAHASGLRLNEYTLDATDFICQLDDSNSDVRWRSMQELSRLGASAVPEIIASLNHRNPEVRRLLVQVLGNLGGAASTAIPSLLVALHDVNSDVRSAAAECLGRLEIVSRPMVQELMQSLFDPNSEVRRYSATTLGRFGQHAREATTALQVAAISDTAAKVRVASQAALQRINESLVRAA